MALRRARRTIHLDGECGVEEALALVEHLAGPGSFTVDLAGCTHLHTALVQAIVAGAPQRIVPPQDAFLARWLMPFLTPAACCVPAPRSSARPARQPQSQPAAVATPA